jgi:hypothetical protein
MPWTHIAAAPHLSPGGAARTLNLYVRTPEPKDVLGGELELTAEPVPVDARIVADRTFAHRVGQPEAHVLADHAATVVECSVLGLAPDALAGFADGDVRLDLQAGTGTAGRLLYRGNVRVEDVRPRFGWTGTGPMGAPPAALFSYDGVERLASVPYDLSGRMTLAATAAALLAPLSHEIPVVTLVGWEHAGQRTDTARAHALRAEAARWGALDADNGATYRDALRAFLVAMDAQLVQHATPASAPGGGGAVWLVVQRSVRTEALRVAAAGGTASPLTAAWVAPDGAVSNVAVSALGLPTVAPTAVEVGTSSPRPWSPVSRVVSRHPLAQRDLRDEDLDEILPGTAAPRWWTGTKLATGVVIAPAIVSYPGEGDVGAFLGTGSGVPDAVSQTTERSYAAGTALDIRITKRLEVVTTSANPTLLRFGVVKAVAAGFPDLYLQPPTSAAATRAWGTAFSYLADNVATPFGSTTGVAECKISTAALPRRAQIQLFVILDATKENSCLALSGSVSTSRGGVDVLGIEATWPGAEGIEKPGQTILSDDVAVGDSTAVSHGSTALEWEGPGGWAFAVSSWTARPSGVSDLAMPTARALDAAEQVGAPLAGVEVRLPRVCLPAADGLSAVPWAGWLEWDAGSPPSGGEGDAVRRLPSCVETDLVTGLVRAVAYPLASGSIAAADVAVYQYGRDGRLGPVEPAAVAPPPGGGG